MAGDTDTGLVQAILTSAATIIAALIAARAQRRPSRKPKTPPPSGHQFVWALAAASAVLATVGAVKVIWGAGDKHEPEATPSTSTTAPPSPSSLPPQPECADGGPTVTDTFGNSYRTVYCDTFLETALHGKRDSSSELRGTLKRGRHWIACQENGAANPVTDRDGRENRNTWWLWTQGDAGNNKQFNGWGWIPATVVEQGTNNVPVPGVQIGCPS